MLLTVVCVCPGEAYSHLGERLCWLLWSYYKLYILAKSCSNKQIYIEINTVYIDTWHLSDSLIHQIYFSDEFILGELCTAFSE